MSDIRQRWRLVLARRRPALDVPHRDVQAMWEEALRGCNLPIAYTEGARPRPRLAFAAPLPVGMLAERELADVGFTERVTLVAARAALSDTLPVGYELVDLHDVWAGAPTVASLVVAGDYRVIAAASAAPGDALASLEAVSRAIAQMLDAPRLERGRDKGSGRAMVDIRPQIISLGAEPPRPQDRDDPVQAEFERAWGERAREQRAPAVPASAGSTEDPFVMLRMRLRLGGDGGAGRPEEVVEVVGERVGRPLMPVSIIRERVILAGEA